MDEYISFYNAKRLNGLSPLEFMTLAV
ncbi:IS3 family transposase [Clostridium butyricum]